jgi:hypothetical protein
MTIFGHLSLQRKPSQQFGSKRVTLLPPVISELPPVISELPLVISELPLVISSGSEKSRTLKQEISPVGRNDRVLKISPVGRNDRV